MQGLSNGFAGLNLFMQVSISPLSNVLHEIHCNEVYWCFVHCSVGALIIIFCLSNVFLKKLNPNSSPDQPQGPGLEFCSSTVVLQT